MIKDAPFLTKIYMAVSYIVFSPVLLIFSTLFWYSMRINGVEPKTGRPLQKYKQVNGESYYKQKGLKNIFKPWKKEPESEWSSADLASMYPSIIVLKK